MRLRQFRRASSCLRLNAAAPAPKDVCRNALRESVNFGPGVILSSKWVLDMGKDNVCYRGTTVMMLLDATRVLLGGTK